MRCKILETLVHVLGLHLFGVDGIIIPKNNSADYANPAVIETSTGGIYDLKLYKVSNISQTIQQLKENGYWISGFSEHGSNFIER